MKKVIVIGCPGSGKMNIATLCDKINLQPQIKQSVLSFVEKQDFKKIDEVQKDYFIYEKMKEALNKTRELLGEDLDGIKILSCMLKASLNAYEVYKEKGISEEIFIATMKCFTRFIDETYRMTGEWCFDRWWWTTRQVGCHLFRIGELEYEIKPVDDDVVISLHIPSDADFSPSAVDKSLEEADKFFERYYPKLSGVKYICHSWLLDKQLQDMLKSDSNIVSFQNRFEIVDEGEADTEFIEWLYNTKSTDFSTLPENSYLQINVKEHLLSGGVIRNSYGVMRENGKKKI